MSERLRRLGVDLVFLGSPFAAALVITLLVGWLLPTTLSIWIATAIAALLGIFSFLMGLDEDDWWDVFRSTRRILLIGGFGSLAVPVLGLAVGISL